MAFNITRHTPYTLAKVTRYNLCATINRYSSINSITSRNIHNERINSKEPVGPEPVYTLRNLRSSRLSYAPVTYSDLAADPGKDDIGKTLRSSSARDQWMFETVSRTLKEIEDGLPTTGDSVLEAFYGAAPTQNLTNIKVIINKAGENPMICTPQSVPGALAIMSGAYGFKNIFAFAIGRLNGIDLAHMINSIHALFFNSHCLAAVIKTTAVAISSQPRGLEFFGKQIRASHHLIAIYMRHMSTPETFGAAVPALFAAVTKTGDIVGDINTYLGFVVGVCIAGLLRYGHTMAKIVEGKAENQRYYESAIKFVANAIGTFGFPGAIVLSQLLDTISGSLPHVTFGAEQLEDVARRLEILLEERVALFADINAAILGSGSPTFGGSPHAAKSFVEFDREVFAKTVNITIRRCGFQA